MNKKIFALLLMSICVTGITACSKNNSVVIPKDKTPTKIAEKVEPKADIKVEPKVDVKVEPKAEVKEGTKTVGKVEEKPEVKESNPSKYSVAGIDDAAGFDRTFKTIQSLVANGEKEKVAEYVRYPITSGNIKVNSKEEFIKNYDSIITDKVKNALVNQKIESLFVNYKGVMAGAGEVWFTVVFDSVSNAPKYFIYAINK